MLTMRAAASLLSASRSLDALKTLVRAVGLAADGVTLDARERTALGLTDVVTAELMGGAGATRVLVVEIVPDVELREALRRMSGRLAARAPHLLWLVAAIRVRSPEAAIITWSGADREPRIAAFRWEPERVVDSDAETLCALAAAATEDEGTRHVRCLEVLGRECLTRRFYRDLRTRVTLMADDIRDVSSDADELALLYATRLLFLCFLEAKGWLNRERAFLADRFDACMAAGGGFHRRVLLPLFFGTLNTPVSRRAKAARDFGIVPFLNGGLFARTRAERRAGRARFSDQSCGALLADVFQRYRFVARENSATWSDASVDPEMLGRAFESLMAGDARRAGGVYYTPHELVARVAERALEARAAGREALRDIRVLDPACGSGAFLVYALERIAETRLSLGERASLAELRRDVLARSIFGIDRNPTAVWLCELRLWLSVVIETDERDPMRVAPLPNLDRNVRVGDTLVGPGFERDPIPAILGGRSMLRLRERYVRATGTRKVILARVLDREERRRVLGHFDRQIASAHHARRELLAAQRARDLFGERQPPDRGARRALATLREHVRSLRTERVRIGDGGALPFSFGAVFADVQARGGFDVIIGNPPWVRLHRIPGALRTQLRRTYEVFRCAPWRAGAVAARAGVGFASQVDLAALFVERSVNLLRGDGIVALLLPAKLWRSLAGGGVRQFLARRTCVVRLEDLSESRHEFDAAVYPSLLVARAGVASSRLALVTGLAPEERAWSVTGIDRIALDESPGAPWVVLEPKAREAFDRLRAAGIPLATSHFGPPRLGVKCGCNAAFLVRVEEVANGIASVVNADGVAGSLEASLIRPALRGDAVRPWTRVAADESIIWTHDDSGAPLTQLPARARSWLTRHYTDLVARTDAARTRRWWSLFRVDAAARGSTRVVWADIGLRPRALVLPADDPTVPLNTCYVVRCHDDIDARALAALLNSRLAAAWLNALAEPARGGYRRYLGWTVGQLPIPRDWGHARATLSAAHHVDAELDVAVVRAYGLTERDVRPLLERLA